MQSEGDREIVCQDCGEPFVFTEAEAAFFQQRSLTTPKRCRPCRDARGRREDTRAERYPTGDPNEYRSPMPCEMPPTVWGRGPQGPRNTAPSASGADRPPRRRARQMFSATCAKCGATAHVPFEPSPGREVFCRGCFDERRLGSPAPKPEE